MSKTRTIEVFVGSNNQTHKVDRAMLERTLGRFVDGWTIRGADGYWEGMRERSVSVLLDIDKKRQRSLFDAILSGNEQRAIAWHRVEPLRFAVAA